MSLRGGRVDKFSMRVVCVAYDERIHQPISARSSWNSYYVGSASSTLRITHEWNPGSGLVIGCRHSAFITFFIHKNASRDVGFIDEVKTLTTKRSEYKNLRKNSTHETHD